MVHTQYIRYSNVVWYYHIVLHTIHVFYGRSSKRITPTDKNENPDKQEAHHHDLDLPDDIKCVVDDDEAHKTTHSNYNN